MTNSDVQELSLVELESLQGGFAWLDAADGFCFVASIFVVTGNPVSVGCTIYGALRVTKII